MQYRAVIDKSCFNYFSLFIIIQGESIQWIRSISFWRWIDFFALSNQFRAIIILVWRVDVCLCVMWDRGRERGKIIISIQNAQTKTKMNSNIFLFCYLICKYRHIKAPSIQLACNCRWINKISSVYIDSSFFCSNCFVWRWRRWRLQRRQSTFGAVLPVRCFAEIVLWSFLTRSPRFSSA